MIRKAVGLGSLALAIFSAYVGIKHWHDGGLIMILAVVFFGWFALAGLGFPAKAGEFLIAWSLWSGASAAVLGVGIYFVVWLGSLWAGSTELSPGISMPNPNPLEVLESEVLESGIVLGSISAVAGLYMACSRRARIALGGSE